MCQHVCVCVLGHRAGRKQVEEAAAGPACSKKAALTARQQQRTHEGSPTKATSARTSSCSALAWPALALPDSSLVAVAVRKMLFAYGLRLLATSPHQMYVWRLNEMGWDGKRVSSMREAGGGPARRVMDMKMEAMWAT